MKKRILALCLACCLFLTGCASMLRRGSMTITPHNETPLSLGDSSILRVETYQEMVSGILYFILEGLETGTMRLYNYTRDVNADLNAACVEVAQEDPIGAYALDFIKFEVTRIVNYYEVQLEFTYRRTPEQLDRIVSVVGTNAIRQELQEALVEFRPEVTLHIGYFTGDEAFLRELLRKAYSNTPQAAFGRPQAVISIYPDSGYQRVVEFQLTYHNTTQQLQSLQSRLLRKIKMDINHLYLQLPENAFKEIHRILHENTPYSPQGSGILQFLLTQLPANSEGFALAACLYAREADFTCHVVEGTLNGEPHFWNIVRTSFGYRHLDPTQPDIVFRSDLAMTQLGYEWDKAYVPQCIDPAEVLPTLPPIDSENSFELFDERS